MPRLEFEPTISAGERPQTYALDRAATGTGYHIEFVNTLLYCTYMFSLETVITCVHCFLFICSSSSRIVTPSGQASGRRGKWSINIMKLILLLVPICCAVAKTHDKLLRLAKGWNTRLRFRMFLFASSLVLVLEVFSG